MELRTGKNKATLVDTLTLTQIRKRKNNEAYLSEPQEVGHYSLDASSGSTEFHNDNHKIRNVFKPTSGWDAPLSSHLCWDLSKGSDKIIKYCDDDSRHRTHILDWILANQEKLHRLFMTPKSKNIDFVCTRHLLKKISLTEKKSKWCFSAYKYKSIIYIFYESDDQTDFGKVKQTFIDYGAIFEKYMTNDNLDEPANRNEGYYVILRAELNDYTLIYSAEVDGKDPDISQSSQSDLKSTKCYVELKSACRITADSYKLKTWWLQAVLGGIPKIICGIRDKYSNKVTELRTYHIGMEKNDGNERKKFKPESETKKKVDEEIRVLYLDNEKEECLSMCRAILDFVKKNVQDIEGVYYTFSYEHEYSSDVRSKRIPEIEDYTHVVKCLKVYKPVTKIKMLPKKFVENCTIHGQASKILI